MENKNIEEVIIKFLNSSITSKDLDYLKEWILNPKNESLFEDYIRSHFEITIGMNEPTIESIKEKLFNDIRKEKSFIYSIRSNPFYRLGAASLIVLLFSLPFIVKKSSSDLENTKIVVQENIEPGTDKATLTLENGAVVSLEKGKYLQIQNASSNGEVIKYTANQDSNRDMVYNFLTTPRAGQFHIVLSDSTEVWLNSESQLKYPVSFVEGSTRQVELVYGEAYFDVSPSSKHEGAKFKVFNRSQEIEVLGTEFNIKAYRDEASIYTTLVEGRVVVNYENRKQNLIPGQQSSLDIDTKNFLVKEVDVYNEISWKEGVFSFERKSLKEIMKVLSRWYDVDVIFRDKSLEDVKFFGVLGKDQNIKEILQTIKKFKIIENYEIKGKIIILK